jgi:hypothetical protein
MTLQEIYLYMQRTNLNVESQIFKKFLKDRIRVYSKLIKFYRISSLKMIYLIARVTSNIIGGWVQKIRAKRDGINNCLCRAPLSLIHYVLDIINKLLSFTIILLFLVFGCIEYVMGTIFLAIHYFNVLGMEGYEDITM